MMKLCYKCRKRPAVVFISDQMKPDAEPQGLCLVCAKESGIKPIDDMLRKMNISDEDIEQMSEQFMEVMGDNPDDESFDMGTAPAFPFLNNIFGSMKPDNNESETTEDNESEPKKKGKDKKERRKIEIEADYIGFDVPNYFVVGYGLDYNGKYRNLQEIGVLKPEIYK